MSSFSKAAVWQPALQYLGRPSTIELRTFKQKPHFYRPDAESQMGFGAGITACERGSAVLRDGLVALMLSPGYRWKHSLQLLRRTRMNSDKMPKTAIENMNMSRSFGLSQDGIG